MRRTQNEIYRLCQKAVRGAGAPAGLEVEAARATAWLSARGLPALPMLVSELSRVQTSQDRYFPYDSQNGPLDADGKSGALIAPLLVDMVLLSAIEKTKPIQIRNLSSPLYLVPPAARYAGKGWCFAFSLRSVEENAFRITVATQSGICIKTSTNSKLAALADETFDVVASCRSATELEAVEDNKGDVLLLDDNALTHADENSLANGVEVDANTWNRLAEFAAKVLVAASEKSRSGAGTTVSDNE